MKCRMIVVELRSYDPPQDGITSEFLDVATGKAPVPGDMFFAPWKLQQGGIREELTDQYWALPEPRRAPLIVVVPARHGDRLTACWHCIDSKCYNKEQGYHGGWKVSGEAPLITVQPSIDIKGWWHGNLTNGELQPE